MTEKQKQAIAILNKLQQNNSIKEDDYFLILEVIVDDNKPQLTYVPFVQPYPQPLDPVYEESGMVTIETSLTKKEEQLNWSEVDDEMLDKIVNSLMKAENVTCADYNIMCNWLNSIKQRIEEQ